MFGLDGQWQKIDRIRLLMGDEVSRRTKKVLLASLEPIIQVLDKSIEQKSLMVISNAGSQRCH